MSRGLMIQIKRGNIDGTADTSTFQMAVIGLDGFLTQLEVQKLKQDFGTLIAENVRYFIVNLSKLKFIDSSGIGAISYLRNETLRCNGILALIRPEQAQVNQSLEFSALPRVISCFSTEDEALHQTCEKLNITVPTELMKNASTFSSIQPVPMQQSVPTQEIKPVLPTSTQKSTPPSSSPTTPSPTPTSQESPVQSTSTATPAQPPQQQMDPMMILASGMAQMAQILERIEKKLDEKK